MDTNQTFLETAEKQFIYYKQLGERAMEQLETEQLFQTWNEDTNSIAVIVKHGKFLKPKTRKHFTEDELS